MLAPNTSLFESFISKTLAEGLDREAVGQLKADLITAPLYPLLFGYWLVTLEYTFTGLFQVEWFIDASRVSEPQVRNRSYQRTPQDLHDCLQRLHKWQRRIPFFTSWLHSAIVSLGGLHQSSHEEHLQRYNALNPGPLHAANQQPPTVVVSDYRTLHERFSNFALRADKIMNTATAITSVQESKRNIEQSQSVSRVTYLAFVFIPLNFVSSFLSMNGDFENQKLAYPKFFEMAVPLCFVIALVIAAYSGHVRKLWVRMTRGTWRS